MSDADSAPDGSLASTVVRGGAIRISGYLLGVLLSTVSAALLYRHLGVINTGLYITGTSLVAIVAAFSDLGLTAYGVREISVRPPEERWSLARDLLGLRLVLTSVGGVIITALSWNVYSSKLGLGVALASAGLLLQVTQDNLSLPLAVNLQLLPLAGLDFLRQFATTGVIAALVFAGAGVAAFLGATIPVGLVVVAATLLLLRSRRVWRPTFSWSRWKRIIRAILPFSLASAAALLYFRASILLVSFLSTPRQLGYFGASYRIIEVLTAVPNLLTVSIFPVLAKRAQEGHDEFRYVLLKVTHIAVLAGGWIIGMVWIGAPLAIHLIAGRTFGASIRVLQLQGIGLGATFLNVAWSYALLSNERYRALLVVNAGALALDIALVAPLTHAAGAAGAAAGTAVCEITLAAAEGVVLTLQHPDLRPPLALYLKTLGGAALGTVAALLSPVPVPVRLLEASLIFTLTLAATRALPEELKAALPRFLSSERRRSRWD